MNELKEDRRTQLATKVIKQLKRRKGNYFLRAGRLLREILHRFGAVNIFYTFSKLKESLSFSHRIILLSTGLHTI